MTNLFRSRIRNSLADTNLQAALDANAERRIQVRKDAFASLTEPQLLRERAHLVRADVIEHLDTYLKQFIAQARKNGLQVHQAADADQAIKTIMEIAGRKGAKLIAKSKTMVSEEIGLNHALEKEGLQVVETDLGEYIVQLRGEPPSHIITPAVHLRRQDVGKLFEDKLGIPYTEDIGIMTDAARHTLRQVFLEADIGISGVNFGVAETGTLCVVTNEGNGRMVTTVPHTHIALMGIERIVPTMEDLALMLSLLPRSATGQKLTVYTSLLNSPRRADDPDGPQERHVILVDNGRNATRASELTEILYCIRCGACLNACPVFREIGGHAYISKNGKGSPYPGPMGSVVSPALFGQLNFGHLARASSLCGACREACPVDIDLPKLLLRVRAGIGTNQNQYQARSNAPAILALGVGLYTLAATSPWRFTVAQRLAGLFGSIATILGKGNPWMHLPAFSGWGYSKDFPLPAKRSFRSRYIKQLKAETYPIEKIVPRDSSTNPADDTSVVLGEGNSVDRFASELKTLGANFTLCTPEEVTKNILDILQTHRINEVLAWDEAFLPERIIDELIRGGIQVHQPSAESIVHSGSVRAGLSGASAGIAETGSLLILGGTGRPLLTSLLPEIHIAILREGDIYKHLHQVLQLEDVKRAPAAILVSGPSRTADIEMTLTIGVHGPGELYVICIRNR